MFRASRFSGSFNFFFCSFLVRVDASFLETQKRRWNETKIYDSWRESRMDEDGEGEEEGRMDAPAPAHRSRFPMMHNYALRANLINSTALPLPLLPLYLERSSRLPQKTVHPRWISRACMRTGGVFFFFISIHWHLAFASDSLLGLPVLISTGARKRSFLALFFFSETVFGGLHEVHEVEALRFFVVQPISFLFLYS
ncbi:hypothetical protein MPH_00800 [Macrophomina phaseolina MS6]|uniref:Uncharacterized protein n=1 Tax=Macrophomina phaseolina (strain MS6) TaxID=1126212 RepID=K2SZ36_MACPH|nr:hypothetical protein MPH_00800 [Macrophomina phaseolina MS6]